MRTAKTAIVLAGIVAVCAHTLAQPQVNPTAAAVDDFNKRVKAYADLRTKESSGLLKPNSTPEEIRSGAKALAEKIRLDRADAKQGDVFTPEVLPVFKKAFDEYYKRRTGREKRLTFDEVPNFNPQVNLTYPVNSPKATFPPRLSLALPQLPEGLEYRLVGTSLVLRDTNANLIVDWIPNIIPSNEKPRTAL